MKGLRILANYKKILRTGMIMSGLLVAGVTLPAVAQNNVDQGTTTDHNRGFNWGLLGLVGLAGLAGRGKRERTVANTARV